MTWHRAGPTERRMEEQLGEQELGVCTVACALGERGDRTIVQGALELHPHGGKAFRVWIECCGLTRCGMWVLPQTFCCGAQHPQQGYQQQILALGSCRPSQRPNYFRASNVGRLWCALTTSIAAKRGTLMVSLKRRRRDGNYEVTITSPRCTRFPAHTVVSAFILVRLVTIICFPQPS